MTDLTSSTEKATELKASQLRQQFLKDLAYSASPSMSLDHVQERFDLFLLSQLSFERFMGNYLSFVGGRINFSIPPGPFP